MGKSSPTPPPAPDPNQIIQTQANANDQSAVLQSTLNNVQYQGPQGDVGYSLSPQTNQWTENVTLNPTEQATFAQDNMDQFQASQLGAQQLHAVDDALQQGLGAPSLQSGAATGSLANSYNPGGQIAYGFSPGGAIQAQVSPTYSPYVTGQAGAPVNPYGTGASGGGAPPQSAAGGSAPTLAQAQAVLGNMPQNAAAVDSYEQWLGNGGGALTAPEQARYNAAAQANPGYNQNQLDYAAFGANNGQRGQNYLQSLATPQGANPGQPAPNSSNPSSSPYATPSSYGQPNALAAIASNPVASTQLATYQQAAQMLNPQWSQASEQEQAQLAAQGLNPNDAAYQNAMQLFGNQENEAYDQAIYGAINAGDAEQNTLYGQNLSAGQFANQAQAQQYSENQGLAQFNNTAQGQANSQNAAAAAFGNQAQGQNFQEQYQNAQLANQAAQQQFQDQAYASELPINEFTALMGNSQVAMPPSSPAQNTSVQVPNVNGAYQLQQNGQQFAYNANEANSQSSLGGLFNLGNSILGLTGL